MDIIYYQMSTNTDFSGWLEERLTRRNMTQADLARESGLTTAGISRIISGSRGPGPDACRAIAKALGLSEELVFRRAGLLSPKEEESEEPEDPPSFWEWVMFYLRASKEERDQMLEMAEELAKENENEESKK